MLSELFALVRPCEIMVHPLVLSHWNTCIQVRNEGTGAGVSYKAQCTLVPGRQSDSSVWAVAEIK